MLTTIEIKRPHCHSPNITRNGKRSGGKQNCRLKGCGRQFASERGRACRGTLSWIKNAVNVTPARRIGVQDAGIAPQVGAARVLKALKSGEYRMHPKKVIMIVLKQTSSWTYAGKSRRMRGGNGA